MSGSIFVVSCGRLIFFFWNIILLVLNCVDFFVGKVSKDNDSFVDYDL